MEAQNFNIIKEVIKLSRACCHSIEEASLIKLQNTIVSMNIDSKVPHADVHDYTFLSL